jgi:hypothetical protein
MPDEADDCRPFPVQGEYETADGVRLRRRLPASSIPWWLAEEAYAQYARHYGTSQSIERMAERGGFSRWELLDLLAGGNGMLRALKEVRSRRG